MKWIVCLLPLLFLGCATKGYVRDNVEYLEYEQDKINKQICANETKMCILLAELKYNILLLTTDYQHISAPKGDK